MRCEQSVISAKQTCLEIKNKKEEEIPPNNNRICVVLLYASGRGRLKKVIIWPLSNLFLPLHRERIYTYYIRVYEKYCTF